MALWCPLTPSQKLKFKINAAHLPIACIVLGDAGKLGIWTAYKEHNDEKEGHEAG